MGSDDLDSVARLRRDLEACRARLQEFVTTLAHELRTPLTSMRGSLGLLTSLELSPDARELAAIAERNTVRLIDLLGNIVDLERLESGHTELEIHPTPIELVVLGAVRAHESAAADRKLAIDVESSDANVRADARRLQQAVRCLLANAIKFSPEGDTIRVTVASDDEWVTVRVTDRGRGVSRSLQPALFDRFRASGDTADGARPKKGVGLPLAKAIVDRHHGTIGVESDEGSGATFWIRVPRAPDPPAPSD